MQDLLLALAAARKNQGKIGFFGADKGAVAHAKALEALERCFDAQIEDGSTSWGQGADVITQQFVADLRDMAATYPNWTDAYEWGAKMIQTGEVTRAAAKWWAGSRVFYNGPGHGTR